MLKTFSVWFILYLSKRFNNLKGGRRNMSRKNKMRLGFSSLLVGGLLLAACGNGGNGDTNGTDGTGDPAEDGNGEEPSGDVVTLTYANWNLGTEGEIGIERLMIDAFNESQDRIEVVIDESVTTDDWDGSLATQASAGNLPDVFMMSNVPTAFANDWLMDITEIAEADEEFGQIADATVEAARIDGQVVSVPFAQHLSGYYVNRDILNDLNLDLAEYGISPEEFFDLIRSSTDIGQDLVGLANAAQIVDWYPGSVSEDMGYFTYNFEDGTYSLDSDVMAEGVNTARDLGANGYTYATLPEEDKERISGGDEGLAFRSGNIAFMFDGTWMNTALTEEADFDWDFIGIPGGTSILINDFLGIAQNTEHPEEAYEFAKFMSFGQEGFTTRMNIVEENNFGFNTLPITTNQEVLDRYWSLVDVPGIQAAYEDIDQAMVEPFKVVPGFANSRYEATTGVSIGEEENANVSHIINESVAGNISYQDYASQLQTLAQQAHDEAVEAMGTAE